MNKKTKDLATKILIEIKNSKKPIDVAGEVIFDIVNEIANSMPEAMGMLHKESMEFHRLSQIKVKKRFIEESVKIRKKRFGRTSK